MAPPRLRAMKARGRTGTVVIACTLMLVAGGLYARAVDYPFVLDDQGEVLENASIRRPSDLAALALHNPTRPLVNVSYMLDYARSGTHPRAYHVTNVVLHMLNVGLAFAFFRRAVKDVSRSGRGMPLPPLLTAAVAAGLFAAHPGMTQAVAYVSSRSELLSATFLLLSILGARHALAVRSGVWALAAGAALLLAAAAREIAAVQPLVVYLYDRLILTGTSEDRRWRLRHLHLPMVAIIGLAALVRVWVLLVVEHHDAGWLPLHGIALEVEAFTRYLSILLAPTSLSLVHHIPPFVTLWSTRAAVALVNVALFVLGAWLLRRPLPLASFGMGWFLLCLLPSAALVAIVPRAQPVAEHRMYLASCGVFLAIAAAAGSVWQRKARWRGALAALGLLVGVALAVATVTRLAVWSHPMLLWKDAVAKAPATWMAQYGYARSLQDDGDCARAAEHYRLAIRLRPRESKAYNNLALCLLETGDIDGARAAVRQARMVAPEDAAILRNAVLFHAMHGTRSELRQACEQLLEVQPDQPPECGR